MESTSRTRQQGNHDSNDDNDNKNDNDELMSMMAQARDHQHSGRASPHGFIQPTIKVDSYENDDDYRNGACERKSKQDEAADERPSTRVSTPGGGHPLWIWPATMTDSYDHGDDDGNDNSGKTMDDWGDMPSPQTDVNVRYWAFNSSPPISEGRHRTAEQTNFRPSMVMPPPLVREKDDNNIFTVAETLTTPLPNDDAGEIETEQDD